MDLWSQSTGAAQKNVGEASTADTTEPQDGVSKKKRQRKPLPESIDFTPAYEDVNCPTLRTEEGDDDASVTANMVCNPGTPEKEAALGRAMHLANQAMLSAMMSTSSASPSSCWCVEVYERHLKRFKSFTMSRLRKELIDTVQTLLITIPMSDHPHVDSAAASSGQHNTSSTLGLLDEYVSWWVAESERWVRGSTEHQEELARCPGDDPTTSGQPLEPTLAQTAGFFGGGGSHQKKKTGTAAKVIDGFNAATGCVLPLSKLKFQLPAEDSCMRVVALHRCRLRDALNAKKMQQEESGSDYVPGSSNQSSDEILMLLLDDFSHHFRLFPRCVFSWRLFAHTARSDFDVMLSLACHSDCRVVEPTASVGSQVAAYAEDVLIRCLTLRDRPYASATNALRSSFDTFPEPLWPLNTSTTNTEDGRSSCSNSFPLSRLLDALHPEVKQCILQEEAGSSSCLGLEGPRPSSEGTATHNIVAAELPVADDATPKEEEGEPTSNTTERSARVARFLLLYFGVHVLRVFGGKMNTLAKAQQEEKKY